MSKSQIAGKWAGQLTYAKDYPEEYRSKIFSFSLDLSCCEDAVKGLCEDEFTNSLALNPATIDGFFKNDSIYFIKRYPCLIMMDEDNLTKAFPTEPSVGIQYRGRLVQRLFSKKKYFKGHWDISGSYMDENGNKKYYRSGGDWEMRKVD
ncbi:MAG: hypothetical protein J0I41_06395 [Filimonas sp.]|nr:hypothetical protein [Filimonas sp.]